MPLGPNDVRLLVALLQPLSNHCQRHAGDKDAEHTGHEWHMHEALLAALLSKACDIGTYPG